MKKQLLALFATSIVLFSCSDKPADKAEDKKDASTTETKKEAAAPLDSATQMKNWQAYMTPGDVHKMIASWDGNWTAETTTWMDPKAPPTKGTADAVNKMILGGRYQETSYKGDFMGMPFEGRGTLAYDNARKIFCNTWIDNMGSGIMFLEGSWDEATKTINLKGKCTDGMTGKVCDVREAFKIVDANTQHLETYLPGPDGKEFKTMEIIFKRKK